MTDAVAHSTAFDHKGIGLSAKLLGLTLVFVLVAEVLIYVPSVANFRLNWLRDRLTAAQTAALVLEAAPDNMVPRSLERDVLRHVGITSLSVRQGDARRMLAVYDMPPQVAATFDLRAVTMFGAVMDAAGTLWSGQDRPIQVVGPHPHKGDFIEITLNETPLREALLAFSRNIVFLSLFISTITATLVYLALVRMFVRPMRRIHENMMGFRESPEDVSRVIVPSSRVDEVGQTEAELQRLQLELQGTLQQKTHLANLGLAIAKISHDLRNVLAAAQLFSDRLATVQDPTVQRLMPKLIGALDRAIGMCRDTLTYGRAVEPAPTRRRVRLFPLVDEAGTALGLAVDTRIGWYNRVPPTLEVDADPDQLFRVLLNLGRNAVQAMESVERRDGPTRRDFVAVSARREGTVVTIELADTGPGVPEAARPKLFRPFALTTRKGGSGLGLAIAAELVQGHGGTIALADGTLGATFLVTLPDRTIDLAERRAERARA